MDCSFCSTGVKFHELSPQHELFSPHRAITVPPGAVGGSHQQGSADRGQGSPLPRAVDTQISYLCEKCCSLLRNETPLRPIGQRPPTSQNAPCDSADCLELDCLRLIIATCAGRRPVMVRSRWVYSRMVMSSSRAYPDKFKLVTNSLD